MNALIPIAGNGMTGMKNGIATGAAKTPQTNAITTAGSGTTGIMNGTATGTAQQA